MNGNPVKRQQNATQRGPAGKKKKKNTIDDYSYDEGSSVSSNSRAIREVQRARAELAIARAGGNKLVKNESEHHLQLVSRKAEIEKALEDLGVNPVTMDSVDNSINGQGGSSCNHMHLEDMDSEEEYAIKPLASKKHQHRHKPSTAGAVKIEDGEAAIQIND